MDDGQSLEPRRVGDETDDPQGDPSAVSSFLASPGDELDRRSSPAADDADEDMDELQASYDHLFVPPDPSFAVQDEDELVTDFLESTSSAHARSTSLGPPSPSNQTSIRDDELKSSHERSTPPQDQPLEDDEGELMDVNGLAHAHPSLSPRSHPSPSPRPDDVEPLDSNPDRQPSRSPPSSARPLSVEAEGSSWTTERDQPIASTSSHPPPSSQPSRTTAAAYATAAARLASAASSPKPSGTPERTLTTMEKTELVATKQKEIEEVMGRHDGLVRQAFHMEKFVDMVGFDPENAKKDSSAVFVQWSEPYDLLANLASSSSTSASAVGSAPVRTTRRQISDRKETLSALDKGKGRAAALLPFNTAEDVPSPVQPKRGAGKRSHLQDGASTSYAYDSDTSQVYEDGTMLPPPKKRGSLANSEPLYKRPKLPDRYTAFDPPSYTHYIHVPDKPPHNHSISSYLSSVTFLTPDDLPIPVTHPQGNLAFLEKQAKKEAALANKIALLQSLGRLGSGAKTTPGGRPLPPPGGRADGGGISRHDAMLEHLVFVHRGVIGEGKARMAGAKKVGRLVLGYWDREGGREERERKQGERERRNGARALAKIVRAKWKLAVLVVRAKLKEEEQRERERLGKEHLDAMLERSGTLLNKRQEDLLGDGLDREGDDEDGDHADDAHSDASQSEEDAASDADVEPDSDEEMEEDRSGPDSEPEAEEADSDDEEEDPLLTNGHELGSPTSQTSSAHATRPDEPLPSRTAASASSPSTPLDPEDGPVKPRSSRRSRSKSNSQDVEFEPVELAGEDGEDQRLELEMEAAEAAAKDEDDSEDEGLLNDAEIPIEELMKRYGYGAPEPADEDEHSDEDAPEEGPDSDDEDAPLDEMDVDTAEVKRSSQSPKATLEDLVPDGAMDVDGQEGAASGQGDESDRGSESGSGSESDSDPDEEEADEDDAVGQSNALVGDDEDAVDGAPPKIRTPFLFRGNLRPYQQAGLEWLASLYNNETNGILADEMGLGKTIQTISLLAYLACEKGMWGPHLIVVPTSVILNWEMEFKKFFPGFKVMTYYGNQRDRKDKRRGWNTENSFNVCITSYQLVLADQHIFRRKAWHYLILDEAHNVKNFRSQRWQTLLGFNAQRRLLLTGTPLQNNLMELWSLLYFLMPAGMQAEGTGFANHKEFSEWFSNPMDKAIESGGQMSEEAKATITRLHTLLRPYLLRRLKADVEKQLPGKFEHVIYCRLAKRQRFLYDEFMSRSQTRETLRTGNFLSIANCLMQLRKVCNHPDLFEVRPIVTSFAMERSVACGFEIQELFVRRRLLAEDDADKLDLDALNLSFTGHEHRSRHAALATRRLDGSHLLPLVTEIIEGEPPMDTTTIAGWRTYRTHQLHVDKVRRWKHVAYLNGLRCRQTPVYGSHLLSVVSQLGQQPHLVPLDIAERDRRSYLSRVDLVNGLVKSYVQRGDETSQLITKFAVIPPNAVTRDLVRYALPTVDPSHPALADPSFDSLHHSAVAHQIAFPDASLLQYDCGKLQRLFDLLRERKAGGHRVLIFTQMTKVLDILEIFLNHHGHRYLRLDGSTKIEERQIITERFNTDDRIFCFIASSRSGGVGINLTGADTVLFFDSDWNPALDKQCQDRAHRIGQTREVNIYRFVSEHTIEENMLKKANQKRLLDNVVIQEGEFTTDYFGKMDWRDMLGEDLLGTIIEGGGQGEQREDKGGASITEINPNSNPNPNLPPPNAISARQMERDLAAAEDEDDRAAGQAALQELDVDRDDFVDSSTAKPAASRTASAPAVAEPAPSAAGESPAVGAIGGDGGGEMDMPGAGEQQGGEERQEGEEEEDEPGAVDDYMVAFVARDWEFFA